MVKTQDMEHWKTTLLYFNTSEYTRHQFCTLLQDWEVISNKIRSSFPLSSALPIKIKHHG